MLIKPDHAPKSIYPYNYTITLLRPYRCHGNTITQHRGGLLTRFYIVTESGDLLYNRGVFV